MNTVVIDVPTSDSVIWGIEKILIEICSAMTNKSHIELDLLEEGPALTETGLYDYLDLCACKFAYDLKNITIFTCNPLETHPYITIQYRPPIAFVLDINAKLNDTSYTKNIDATPFAMFIGRGNAPRLHLASFVNALNKNSIISYHYDLQSDFHIQHSSIDDVIQFVNTMDVVSEAKFIKKCPIRLDNEEVSYPMSPNAVLDIHPYYSKFLIEIVCETYYSGNTFFPNEKTWRPIMLKTPFIIHGPTNFLNNLKKMGFKTFDRWWDEGYSEDPPEYAIILIKEILHKLNKTPMAELHKMYADMHDTLEHNHMILTQLSKTNFLKINEQ